MTDLSLPERVHVSSDGAQVGVIVAMGEVRVSITSPAPAGFAQLDIEPMRAAALRLARRALDVAREELDHEA